MNEEEAFAHLRKTFDDACRLFPEIMEPYVTRFEDTKEFMRAALRETFQQRFPSRRRTAA